ncbi:S53 family peptidase [Gandjariella thermophila]|uniref:Pseudomonapepsin n=1 Tax=Gandjariella thermophila TaxID=1931992 RepID=A0A4D4J4E9_9PSEU|nr:S53 family serine peptidase [Gandjariella thermophila]GDY31565.1 pseudomonapepsin [Gandjariella thermophila]
MKPRLRTIGAIMAPLAVVGTVVAITQSADASPGQQPRAALSGNMLPDLAQTQRMGDVPDTQRMSVAISLAPRNQADLDRFVAEVSDPASPNYGHYLTSRQFAARYGAAKEQVDKVSDYLRAGGLSVDSVSPNNLIIEASGPASAVEQTFATHLSDRYDARTKQHFYANDSEPSLPADLATGVVGVAGLDNHARFRHPSLRPAAAAPQRPGFTPPQLQGAYDVPATKADGAGQKIALFELDAFQQANIDTFDKQFNLPASKPKVQKVDGGVQLGEGQTEVELDIETIQAVAPKAQLTVFEAPNTEKGAIDEYAAIVNSGIPVVSISWGAPEQANSAASLKAQHALYQQAAAQGQSMFAASGDNGSDDAGNGGKSVDYPASDPFITGTGGTHLTVNQNNTYGGETGWVGAGGGSSALFNVPNYQANLPNNAARKRMVPDIAADADPASGIVVFSAGKLQVVGGTSAAAPQWAGLAALFNQTAAAKGKPRLGFANPTLYKLAGSAGGTTALHDIIGGSNGAFTAVRGYDQVTGLGSFDAAKFIAALRG